MREAGCALAPIRYPWVRRERGELLRIGIISDTHGVLADGVHEAFNNVDYIIHAGDIGNPTVLWELEGIAPVFACLGNNDWQDYGNSVRACVKPIIGGVRIAVSHYPETAVELARTGEFGLVVHGHTHVPSDKVIGACRIINPGSASRPRMGSARQCCTLCVEDGAVGPLRIHLL